MVALGILRCPVCEKVCFYRQAEITARDRLKEMASGHLSSHRLDESKHGIYRVMMADRSGHIEADETADTALRDWIPREEGPPQAVQTEIES